MIEETERAGTMIVSALFILHDVLNFIDKLNSGNNKGNKYKNNNIYKQYK